MIKKIFVSFVNAWRRRQADWVSPIFMSSTGRPAWDDPEW